MENNELLDDFKEEEFHYHAASSNKRLANFFIDRIVYFIFSLVFFIGLSFISFDFFESLAQNRIIDFVISSILYALFMFAQEMIFNGRSIGKFITGTRVVMEDGSPLNADTLLKRNFSRVVPFEPFSFLGDGAGWHDKWSNTAVVEA